MGGNIPGGNFPGGNLMGGNFPGVIFLWGISLEPVWSDEFYKIALQKICDKNLNFVFRNERIETNVLSPS